MLRSLLYGLRRLTHGAEADQELNEEVEQYIAAAAAEYVRRGWGVEAAARQARIDFGGAAQAKEAVREYGWDGVLFALWRDLVFGARGLRRNPAFTTIALVTLALGIGANAAMFSVVNTVVLRPLPYREPKKLALVWTDDVQRGLHQEPTAWLLIQDWRSRTKSFESIAAYSAGRAVVTDAATRVSSRRAFVSGNLFATLGASAAVGRVIDQRDEDGAAPVAVVSAGFAMRRYGGLAAAIDSTIQIEGGGKGGGAFRIVGVMPPEFFFPDKTTEIWSPATGYWRFTRESSERFAASARRWTMVGRLAPDRSVDDARTEMRKLGATLAAMYTPNVPDFPGFATTVAPALDAVAGQDLRATLWLLLGAVGVVLLVACTNVANLLLARGTSRQHEIHVRAALGAGRGRIIGQLAVESLLLGVAGGVIGLALASYATSAIAGSGIFPRADELRLDWHVVLFALFVSIAASVLFGAMPALRLTREDPGAMSDGARSTGRSDVRQAQSLLILAECALAVVLLTGAGLLLRSLNRLHSVDPGFDPKNVLSVRIEFPQDADAEHGPAAQHDIDLARGRAALAQQLVARVDALPGVVTAGYTDDLFLSGSGNKTISIPGRSDGESVQLNDGALSPDYFATMHVPLEQGRYLTSADVETKIHTLWAPPGTTLYEPVVVNEAFVREFFPNENPLGKVFCIDPTNKIYWYRIVGVIRDLRRQGLDRAPFPEYFGAFFPAPSGRADLVVKTKGDPIAALASVRQAIREVVPRAIIGRASSLDRQLSGITARRDVQTWLLTSFAALALILSAVGIFGVVHYSVSERRREIGVRIALGARPVEVLKLVVARGMAMPALGIVIGLVISLGLTRLLSRLLFGIAATDPATFVGMGVVLAIVAAAACYLPAKRATKLDVVQVLRRE